MPEETTFQRKVREYREAQAAQAQQETQPEWDPALVPEIRSLRPQDEQLEQIVSGIDIRTAYRKWCNKSPVPTRRQTEGLKVSCPNPAHPDKNPSAWLNTDKDLWYCAKCELGGDQFDIAAFKYGYSVPAYRRTDFRAVKEQMATDMGYVKKSTAGSTWYEEQSTAVQNPVDDTQSDTATPSEQARANANIDPRSVGSEMSEAPVETVPPLASVTVLYEDTDEDDMFVFPGLPWRDLVPDKTFLDIWMGLTTKDDVAEEYHFWNGLMALGMAIGRDVTLYDQIPVLGNLFMCIVGHSGDGKSQSARHLKQLLHDALPYKHTDPNSKGVRVVSGAASAEVLIHHFSKPIPDPTDPKKVAYYAPVRGVIEYNELSALVGRTSRLGNVLQPALMDFYDASRVVSTSSMTHGTKEAHESYASLATTTQPRAFRDLVRGQDIHSGFLNRILFVGGVQKKRRAIGGVMIDVKPAVGPLQNVHAWSGKGRELTWDEDAADAFEEFYHDFVWPTKKRDDSGLLVRIDLTLKKLALLLTVNQQQDSVSLETVKHLVPIFNYLLGCYGIANEAIGNTLHAEMRGVILRHIASLSTKNGGKGATQRELVQRMHRGRYPIEQITKILKFMTDLGEIEKEEANVRTDGSRMVGRPSVRYKVVE